MLWQERSPIRKRKVPFLSILEEDSTNEKPCTLFMVAPPTPQLPFLLYKSILFPLPCGNLQGWGTQIIILCKSWMNPSLLEKCLAVYLFLVNRFLAPHSSTLAWKIPWMEEPGRLQSMGSLRVGHHWATSLSLFTFMHWKRKWQPTPVFLPGESQGWGSLVGCRLWGRTELDTTEGT